MKLFNVMQLIADTDPSTGWRRVHYGNKEVVFNKSDVNVRFESTYDDEDIQQGDFKEVWANSHPSASATGYFMNLYYGSTLIERKILVAVDGSRAMIPLPEMGTNEISKLDYHIAKIFDTSSSLDEYIKRSQLTVSTT